MAKNCCVCEAKLGAFDKSASLIAGNDAFLLCSSCEEKLRDAKKTDIDPSNESLMAYHRRAIDHFADRMATGELDVAVVAALESLPGIVEKKSQAENAKAQAEENERRYREERDSVLVTTGFSFDGYTIVDYHGVVSTDNIIGTGIISEFKAGVSDILGESSNAFKDKLRSAKTLAYRDLVKEAILAGGNAVIGVSYNVYVVGSMLGVSVTGTSVTVTK